GALWSDAVESCTSISVSGVGAVAGVRSVVARRPYNGVIGCIECNQVNSARLTGVKPEAIIFLRADGTVSRPRPTVLVLDETQHHAVGMVGKQQRFLVRFGKS